MKENNHKVLVTGATGFIGRRVLLLLNEKGYEVHAVCIGTEMELPIGAHWHKANLLNAEDAKRVVSEVGASSLLHFAWVTEHKKYWTSPENHTWVKASFALAEEFTACGGQRIVMAGTCAEYDWSHGICSERTTPLVPATLYGACKNALREKLEVFSKKNGLSSAWGRIFFLYGPGEHPDRLVSSVINSLLREEPVACSDGYQERDFLFVNDVASAFVDLLSSDVTGAINIGSGVAVSIRKVVEMISGKIGRTQLVRFGELPVSPNDPPVLLADAGRLKKELKWSPSTSLDEGLDSTIQWWRDRLKKG